MSFKTVNGRTDDDGCLAILWAHLWAFGSGELIDFVAAVLHLSQYRTNELHLGQEVGKHHSKTYDYNFNWSKLDLMILKHLPMFLFMSIQLTNIYCFPLKSDQLGKSTYFSPAASPSEHRFKFNPHLPSGLVHPYQLDESICHLRGVCCIFFIFILFLYKILWANSVDPDQTPRSDLGLHCLPMSQKVDAKGYGLSRDR